VVIQVRTEGGGGGESGNFGFLIPKIIIMTTKKQTASSGNEGPWGEGGVDVIWGGRHKRGGLRKKANRKGKERMLFSRVISSSKVSGGRVSVQRGGEKGIEKWVVDTSAGWDMGGGRERKKGKYEVVASISAGKAKSLST